MFRKPDVSRLKGAGDIAGLIKALGYRKDESVPAKAAGALGDVGDQRAIEPLAAWIRQASGHDDRVVAIGSIGKIGGPAAADALLDLLTRPPERAESADGHSVSVQPEVARQLAEVGDERAIRPLEAWIRQDMPYPHVGAIDSIGKIGGQVAADVLLKLFNDVTADARAARVRASVASALGEAGDQRAIDPLKAWLYQTDKSDDRKAAIDSIGKIGGSAVTDFLLELVPDTRFRDSATAALGYTGDPRALARLLQLLTDASDSLSAVASGLGRFGDSRAVVPLCTLLSEKFNTEDKKYIRHIPAIAEALGMLGDSRAVPSLCEMIDPKKLRSIGWNTPKQRNFISAVQALERIGDPSALPALNRVRTSPPSEERLNRASYRDFDAGYEAAMFGKARSVAVSRAIAALEGLRLPHRGRTQQ